MCLTACGGSELNRNFGTELSTGGGGKHPSLRAVRGPPSVCAPEGIYCECRMVPICQRPSCCLVSLCVLITAIEVQAMVEQLRRFTAQLSKGYLRAGHLSKRERASSHSIRHVFAFVYPKKGSEPKILRKSQRYRKGEGSALAAGVLQRCDTVEWDPAGSIISPYDAAGFA